jgi:hypothetical protein
MDNLPVTVGKTLDVLSARFGVVGLHLWQVYVQYTWAEACTCVVIGLALLTIAAIYDCKCIKIYDFFKERESSHSDAATTTTVIASILALILFGTGLGLIGANIPGVLAPEGAAIYKIVHPN